MADGRDHGPGWRAGHRPRSAAIDGIGTWLAAVLDDCGAWDDRGSARDELAGRIAELIGTWRQTSAHVVAVSDETGLGVCPQRPPGGCSGTSSGG